MLFSLLTSWREPVSNIPSDNNQKSKGLQCIKTLVPEWIWNPHRMCIWGQCTPTIGDSPFPVWVEAPRDQERISISVRVGIFRTRTTEFGSYASHRATIVLVRTGRNTSVTSRQSTAPWFLLWTVLYSNHTICIHLYPGEKIKEKMKSEASL